MTSPRENNNNTSSNAGNTTDREGAKYKNNILNYYFAEKEKKNENKNSGGAGIKITNTNNLFIEDSTDDLLFTDHDIKTLNNLYDNSSTTEEFYKELRNSNISKQGLNLLADPNKFSNRPTIISPTSQKIPPNLPPLLPTTNYGALELEMSENPFIDPSMINSTTKMNMPISSYNPVLDDYSLNGAKSIQNGKFTDI